MLLGSHDNSHAWETPRKSPSLESDLEWLATVVGKHQADHYERMDEDSARNLCRQDQERFNRIKGAAEHLARLAAEGVDNWEGYVE